MVTSPVSLIFGSMAKIKKRFVNRGDDRGILSLLCGEQKRQNPARAKYWEIIADRLSKARWDQCGRVKFSKCIAGADRAERGF